MCTVKRPSVNRIIRSLSLHVLISSFALIGLLACGTDSHRHPTQPALATTEQVSLSDVFDYWFGDRYRAAFLHHNNLRNQYFEPAGNLRVATASMMRYPTFFNPPLGTTPSWEMSAFNNSLGFSIDGKMDINGDGHDDFVAGAFVTGGSFNQGGYANVHFGGPSGVAGSPYWEAYGSDHDFRLGYRVAGAGDVNGDGFDDVLISGVLHRAYGIVRLYMGSAAGLSPTFVWERSPTVIDNSYYGWSLAKAGDLNGDGFGDIVIGSPQFYNGPGSYGLVEVFYGSASGIPATPSWTGTGTGAIYNYGGTVTAADINGDGYDDLIIGAGSSDVPGLSSAGRAFVYNGGPGGIATTPNQTFLGQAANEFLGAIVKSCGDLNNDGYDDVLISRQVNWVKMMSFYYGSASGLNTTPALSIQGADQYNPLESKMIGTGGDVNADGCADIILGCQSCPNGAGKKGTVSIYFGKPEGLQSTPAWQIENTSTNSWYWLGTAVSTAGDLNGDGFDEVLVSLREITTVGNADRYTVRLYSGGTLTLPVTLTSFSYQCIHNKPQLHWRTEMELNTERFEVECSTNGNNWKVIGRLQAMGTNQGPADYRFELSQTPPAQYRLKMVDQDGSVSYSSILNIKNACSYDKQFTWTVNPNPAKPGGKVQLNISNYPYSKEPVKVQLTDLKGHRQSLKTFTIPGNTALFLTDVSLPPMLPAGVYVLSIGNSHLRECRRVLVSK